MRQIAHRRGVSVGVVHKVAADVHIQLPNAWHQARLPKAAPLPYLTTVHRLHSPERYDWRSWQGDEVGDQP